MILSPPVAQATTLAPRPAGWSNIDSPVTKAWTQTLLPPLEIGDYIPKGFYQTKGHLPIEKLSFNMRYFDTCFVAKC